MDGAKMAEMRRDPLTDTYVLFAESRADRPHEFQSPQPAVRRERCPFCLGNEQLTPDELASYAPLMDRADLPWQVRVVPNKYPAVFGRAARKDEDPSAASDPDSSFMTAPSATDSAWWSQPEKGGAHEVIIESPLHLRSFTDLSEAEIAFVMRVYRDRLVAAEQDPDLAYALLFKNNGARAGASLEHIHSQLLALPFVPAAVQYELSKTADYAVLHGVGPLVDMIQDDLASGERIVEADEWFVLWCPYASRFPYETWIVPRARTSRFEDVTEAELSAAANWLRRLLLAYETLDAKLAYNFWIHSAPFRQSHPHFRWRLEVTPRATSLAGFELASGCFINPVFPEQAAQQLRELMFDQPS